MSSKGSFWKSIRLPFFSTRPGHTRFFKVKHTPDTNRIDAGAHNRANNKEFVQTKRIDLLEQGIICRFLLASQESKSNENLYATCQASHSSAGLVRTWGNDNTDSNTTLSLKIALVPIGLLRQSEKISCFVFLSEREKFDLAFRIIARREVRIPVFLRYLFYKPFSRL